MKGEKINLIKLVMKWENYLKEKMYYICMYVFICVYIQTQTSMNENSLHN